MNPAGTSIVQTLTTGPVFTLIATVMVGLASQASGQAQPAQSLPVPLTVSTPSVCYIPPADAARLVCPLWLSHTQPRLVPFERGQLTLTAQGAQGAPPYQSFALFHFPLAGQIRGLLPGVSYAFAPAFTPNGRVQPDQELRLAWALGGPGAGSGTASRPSGEARARAAVGAPRLPAFRASPPAGAEAALGRSVGLAFSDLSCKRLRREPLTSRDRGEGEVECSLTLANRTNGQRVFNLMPVWFQVVTADGGWATVSADGPLSFLGNLGSPWRVGPLEFGRGGPTTRALEPGEKVEAGFWVSLKTHGAEGLEIDDEPQGIQALYAVFESGDALLAYNLNYSR